MASKATAMQALRAAKAGMVKARFIMGMAPKGAVSTCQLSVEPSSHRTPP